MTARPSGLPQANDLAVEQQICFLLHLAHSKVIGTWDRFLRRYDLSFSEYVVLLAVWEQWPVSENALAFRLGFDPYTLEDALANLERRRLVCRSADPDMPGDRLVQALPKGVDFQPELLGIRDAFLCDIGLSEQDVEALRSQLENVLLACARRSSLAGIRYHDMPAP